MYIPIAFFLSENLTNGVFKVKQITKITTLTQLNMGMSNKSSNLYH